MKRFLPILLTCFLALGLSLSAQDSTGLSPVQTLAIAIQTGDVGEIRHLLNRDPKLLNVVAPESGMTPLAHAMSLRASKKVLDAIFSYPVDANQKTALGTPIQIAVVSGFPEGVRRLAAAGADVNQKMQSGDTLLHAALGRALLHPKDAASLVTVLIQAGADVNQLNRLGVPPLVLAAGVSIQNDALGAGLISELLRAGADPNPSMKFDDEQITLSQMLSHYRLPKTEAVLNRP